jgi:hypothetical protein
MAEGSKATQFKKGAPSPNPGGRPRIPEELKKYGGITPERTRRLFDKFGSMSMAELRAAAQDMTLSGLEWNIVQALINPDKFPFFLDRAIGKTPERVEQTNLNIDFDPAEYEAVPVEALIKLVSNE